LKTNTEGQSKDNEEGMFYEKDMKRLKQSGNEEQNSEREQAQLISQRGEGVLSQGEESLESKTRERREQNGWRKRVLAVVGNQGKEGKVHR